VARTSTYDALVIGAGPAGSAAAWALARDGLRVVLVDQHTFPRDKVCGDALIPDALGALDAMGLRAAVEAGSVQLPELRLFAPGGRYFSLRGEFSCMPRLRFDHMLVQAAVDAGATLLEGTTATAPLMEDGRVRGAALRTASGPLTIDASFTLLATGANATVMSAFGVQAPMKPSAAAGRAYFRVPCRIAQEFNYLCIAFDRSFCPGYGWIFPGPDNRFNLGVGLFAQHGVNARGLQTLWRQFIRGFEPAVAIVRQSEQLTEFCGAPMRTGLAGPSGRPGLLVLGEAAATTYPATGEGIGKAMESGLLAAQFVGEVFTGRVPAATVHEMYASEFRARFLARYRAYCVAQTWSSRPWRLNLLARRANRGRFVRTELESLVAERGDPRHLFSPRGFLVALIR
jgi:geranylgeranyl reductase family protein